MEGYTTTVQCRHSGWPNISQYAERVSELTTILRILINYEKFFKNFCKINGRVCARLMEDERCEEWKAYLRVLRSVVRIEY